MKTKQEFGNCQAPKQCAIFTGFVYKQNKIAKRETQKRSERALNEFLRSKQVAIFNSIVYGFAQWQTIKSVIKNRINYR